MHAESRIAKCIWWWGRDNGRMEENGQRGEKEEGNGWSSDAQTPISLWADQKGIRKKGRIVRRLRRRLLPYYIHLLPFPLAKIKDMVAGGGWHKKSPNIWYRNNVCWHLLNRKLLFSPAKQIINFLLCQISCYLSPLPLFGKAKGI